VIAVGLVRLDPHDAVPLQLAQQRGGRVFDRAPEVAGGGGGARAGQQAFDVGLDLARGGGGGVIDGGLRFVARRLAIGRRLRDRVPDDLVNQEADAGRQQRPQQDADAQRRHRRPPRL
jgi:hypothetical protein